MDIKTKNVFCDWHRKVVIYLFIKILAINIWIQKLIFFLGLCDFQSHYLRLLLLRGNCIQLQIESNVFLRIDN